MGGRNPTYVYIFYLGRTMNPTNKIAAKVLLDTAIIHMLNGDSVEAKRKLKDCVKLTIGFIPLSEQTGIPSKSLIRMLSDKGNPTIEHFSLILKTLSMALSN